MSEPTDVAAIVAETRDDVKEIKRMIEAVLAHLDALARPLTLERAEVTLTLDELELRDAQRAAATEGIAFDVYVTRALRDARLRTWHRDGRQ